MRVWERGGLGGGGGAGMKDGEMCSLLNFAAGGLCKKDNEL